jgi:hypothetical protein
VADENLTRRADRPKPKPWRPSERVEQMIEEAMEQGLFDNLPGRGKPLDLSDEDNPFVPRDMKLAYRMLRQHGFVLPWIDDRKDIERKRAEIERRVTAEPGRLRRALESLSGVPAHLQPARQAALQEQHRKLRAEIAASIDALNQRIDTYNLAAPTLSVQARRVNRAAMLARLDAASAEMAQP